MAFHLERVRGTLLGTIEVLLTNGYSDADVLALVRELLLEVER